MNAYVKKGITVFIIAIIIGWMVIMFTPLSLVKGTLTNKMAGITRKNGYAYIYIEKDFPYTKEWLCASGSMREWNKRYHVNLEYGDKVVALCRISPKETAPTETRLYWIWEVW